MSEVEAVGIATAFIRKEQIPIAEIEKVFFVPVAAYDYQPPGLTDSWVVHFRVSMPNEHQADLLLSGDPGLLIVTINVATGIASFMSTL